MITHSSPASRKCGKLRIGLPKSGMRADSERNLKGVPVLSVNTDLVE